ncbi:MAG: nucleotidyltransferase domain-containing protein [Oceanospirillaceae bacterium]|nr:nucleotidyltransferase domain-containing protein [Oceanospirillaceae bacterium]
MSIKTDSPAISAENEAFVESLRILCTAQIKHLRLAILFGSCGKGTARPDSDIDLAVLAKKPLSLEERESLIDEIAVLTGRPVDLVDLFDVGEPLLNQILSTGRRVAGENTEFAKLMMRNVVANADFVPLQQRLLKKRRDRWIRS